MEELRIRAYGMELKVSGEANTVKGASKDFYDFLAAKIGRDAEAIRRIREKMMSAQEESKNPAQFTRIYQFSSLDLVCEAARQTGAVFKGNSVLYKNPENGVFYLILKKENDSESSFNRVCNTLSEYGTRLKGDAAASGAYYAEHYDVIVKKDALKVLQNL